MLNASSCEISLADIYKAVKNTNVLGKKNSSPNPKCPIGRDINNKLESLFDETDEIVYNALLQRTLKSFVEQFD